MIAAGRADRGDPAFGQHDQRRGEPGHFGDRVADIDDRHRARRAAARYRAGSRPCAPRRARPAARPSPAAEGAKQGAADRDALLLAARQIRRPAAEQPADAEQVDDVVDLAGAPRLSARTSGRRAGSAAPSGAGTGGLPETHSRSGAAAAAQRRRARCRSAPRRRRRHGPARGAAARRCVDQRGLAGARAAEQRGQSAGGCRMRHRARSCRAGGGSRHSTVTGRAPGASPARSTPRRRTATQSRSPARPASAATRRDRRRAPGSACRSRSARSGFRPGCSRRR